MEWEEAAARCRRNVRFSTPPSFDERLIGRRYDGADVLERTPRVVKSGRRRGEGWEGI